MCVVHQARARRERGARRTAAVSPLAEAVGARGRCARRLGRSLGRSLKLGDTLPHLGLGRVRHCSGGRGGERVEGGLERGWIAEEEGE